MPHWLTIRSDLRDWICLFIGTLLALSPWMYQYASREAAISAMLGGAAIAALSFAALVVLGEWEEWVNLGVGLAVAAAPWLLRFGDDAAASIAHVLAGTAVAVLASWELGDLRAAKS